MIISFVLILYGKVILVEPNMTPKACGERIATQPLVPDGIFQCVLVGEMV